MKFFTLLLLAVLLGISACTNVEKNDSPNELTNILTKDPHSYANIDEVRTTHLHLDLDVNFENNRIYGVATHEISSHTCDKIIFDIKGLEIIRVTLDDGKKEAAYKIGKQDELMGQPLEVAIKPDTKKVAIHYQTSDSASALDWLPPSLTTGKKHPFLYTQGQAVLTRTWIPVQDSPLNRITYSAEVKVPAELMAVMSATHLSQKNTSGVYKFKMKQAIPCYLIALAVGDLEYRALDKRSGIFAEPELIDQCVSEFEDLPRMMRIAEEIYGKYQWEKYDVIMLPYSFPFGGMENPRLTFANPTLLAGDKSLVSVIAHELAHSWSGNLVTNATWNDFWLNEGFTVYFENRIMEKLQGKEAANILAIIEYQDLVASLEAIEESEHPEDANLKLNLEHRDPDDGMTDVAYVKGAYFLRTLEKKVGRTKFDAFLKKYFKTYSFKTLTTEEFVAYLEKNLLEPNKVDFNVNEWIYQPGLPDNCVEINSERLKAMEGYAVAINMNTPIAKNKQYSKLKREDRITQEWQTFIRTLSDTLSDQQLKSIDDQFQFSTSANDILKSDWFKLCAKADYKGSFPHMRTYLLKVGRRWLVEGIYAELAESNDPTRLAFARSVFEDARKNYHAVTAGSIANHLKVE
jgi:leukotriene-A4 hydrolase